MLIIFLIVLWTDNSHRQPLQNYLWTSQKCVLLLQGVNGEIVMYNNDNNYLFNANMQITEGRFMSNLKWM